MSGIAGESAVTRRRLQWIDGILIGLVAAIISTVVLLLAGAASGRGVHILADAGMTALPSALSTATGISAGLSYLLCHTVLYILAGVVAIKLAGLADRLPPLVAGLVLIVIIIEFGFLVLTTESQASGRVDQVVWRALLIAHAVGGVVFGVGIVRVHPSLRQALVGGYEW